MKLVGVFARDVQADMDSSLQSAKFTGYLARKVEANSSVAACCKQELAHQVEISVELERGGKPFAVFNA